MQYITVKYSLVQCSAVYCVAPLLSAGVQCCSAVQCRAGGLCTLQYCTGPALGPGVDSPLQPVVSGILHHRSPHVVTAGLMIYIKTLQSNMAMPGMAWNPLKKQAGQLAAKPLLTQVFCSGSGSSHSPPHQGLSSHEEERDLELAYVHLQVCKPFYVQDAHHYFWTSRILRKVQRSSTRR